MPSHLTKGRTMVDSNEQQQPSSANAPVTPPAQPTPPAAPGSTPAQPAVPIASSDPVPAAQPAVPIAPSDPVPAPSATPVVAPVQQPQPVQPTASAVVAQPSKQDKAGTVALVCGLCSFAGILLAIAGWVLGIIAIVFGAKGLRGAKRSQAIAGLVLGIIGLLLSVFNSLLGVAMMLL